jgi:glutamate carboxypeptidase
MAHPPVSEAMRQWLEAMVKIESPSGDVEGIGRVMEFLAGELHEVAESVIEHTASGPMLTVSRGSGGALLLGHADTVWPKGTLKAMPWRDEGDWVYGPGALDMKGGLALALQVLKTLPAAVPFTLLVTPDEEVGSQASRPTIEALAKRSSLVLVLESGMPGGAIKIGRAGVGDFRANIVGLESHAGLEPEKGSSAVRELAHQVLWLEGLENKVMGTTLNVGVVAGGTRSNVVAGSAQAHVDVRVTTRSEMERIVKTLKAPPRFDSRCRVEYEGSFNRPPMEPTSGSQSWVARAADVWQSLTGEPLDGVRVGGASDGNFTAELTPTLDGLGPIGKGAHARHEAVEWRYMEPRAALIHALVTMAEER